eukprot:14003197-Alexandrium_andersonii.AAC.1
MDPSAGKCWRSDLRPFQSKVLAHRCWHGDQPSSAGTALPDRTLRASLPDWCNPTAAGRGRILCPPLLPPTA